MFVCVCALQGFNIGICANFVSHVILQSFDCICAHVQCLGSAQNRVYCTSAQNMGGLDLALVFSGVRYQLRKHEYCGGNWESCGWCVERC